MRGGTWQKNRVAGCGARWGAPRERPNGSEVRKPHMLEAPRKRDCSGRGCGRAVSFARDSPSTLSALILMTRVLPDALASFSAAFMRQLLLPTVAVALRNAATPTSSRRHPNALKNTGSVRFESPHGHQVTKANIDPLSPTSSAVPASESRWRADGAARDGDVFPTSTKSAGPRSSSRVANRWMISARSLRVRF